MGTSSCRYAQNNPGSSKLGGFQTTSLFCASRGPVRVPWIPVGVSVQALLDPKIINRINKIYSRKESL